MIVKKAGIADAFMLLLLLKEMHEGAVLKIPDINTQVLANKLDELIKRGIVFVAYNKENELMGSIGGQFVTDWWGKEQYLSDYWFFVPKRFRKSKAAIMLVKSFINRAKSSNVPVRLGHIFSGDIARKDKFYERLGFTKAGSIYVANN